jgi:trehalose synthase-fused probable maltokinase
VIEELRAARWFGGKSRPIQAVTEVDRAEWVAGSALILVEVTYAYGAPETYVLAERLEDPTVATSVLQAFDGRSIPSDGGGAIQFQHTRLLAALPPDRAMPVAPMRGEQSNTSIRFGDSLILKLFRRLHYGPNPDVEIGRFLTERTTFRGTPGVAGSIEYRDASGAGASLALLQQFEANVGDAWTSTVARLIAVVDGADMEESVERIALLARTTADLHLALASGDGDFSPEVIDADDTTAWREAVIVELDTALTALAARDISVDTSGLHADADGIACALGSLKIRHHGDYHLGQVLERVDGSYAIIDFEGEPAKPLDRRREKRSPLRDVAGMLRSFDYARFAALRSGDAAHRVRVARAASWYERARHAFLDRYVETVRRDRPALLPSDPIPALRAMELEKAAYEVLYELNNRPDWLPIPLAALIAG